MFTQSAFTENTLEICEWLENIGYEYLLVDETDTILYTKCIKGHWFYCTTTPIDDFPKEFIDCSNNPDLFKAITALRDDSDYMQWFINVNGDFFLCIHKYVKLCVNVAERKATPEELITHFKNI